MHNNLFNKNLYPPWINTITLNFLYFNLFNFFCYHCPRLNFHFFFKWQVSLNCQRFLFLISWRLITLQYCSGFCHTLTWISHGYTCIPHPDLPSHLPLHQSPLGLRSAPGPSTCFKRTASKLPQLLKINDIFNSFPDHHSFFLRHLFVL